MTLQWVVLTRQLDFPTQSAASAHKLRPVSQVQPADQNTYTHAYADMCQYYGCWEDTDGFSEDNMHRSNAT